LQSQPVEKLLLQPPGDVLGLAEEPARAGQIDGGGAAGAHPARGAAGHRLFNEW